MGTMYLRVNEDGQVEVIEKFISEDTRLTLSRAVSLTLAKQILAAQGIELPKEANVDRLKREHR